MKGYVIFMTQLCFLAVVNAQSVTLSGKVLDATQKTELMGVEIKNESNGDVTTTDMAGNYEIKGQKGDEVSFSFIGYETQYISLVKTTSVSIKLGRNKFTADPEVELGSRTSSSSKTESPVPVDLVALSPLQTSAGTADLISVLNSQLASFNYNRQSGTDTGDPIDVASFRGLSTDHTLVLVNGKRRHQTSLIGVFGTRGRGNSGTDLGAISLASIDRIEVLRDGASAQYGSDAIGGVVNIVLKKDVKKLTGAAGWSGHYDDKYNTVKDNKDYYPQNSAIDGNLFFAHLNYGLGLGKNGGLLNLALDYRNQGGTYRQDFSGALPKNEYRRTFGNLAVSNLGGGFNLELPFKSDKSAVLYSFGNFNFRSGLSAQYTRTFEPFSPNFPTDAQGDYINNNNIIRVDSDGLAHYTPYIGSKIHDLGFSVGVKGETEKAWAWDVSNTSGSNRIHYSTENTFNPGLGATKNNFDNGGMYLFQNTTNFNMNKKFNGIAKGLGLAMGLEYRFDHFGIFAGEPDSYSNNSSTNPGGSQGLPGFAPQDVVSADRHVGGVFVEGELSLTDPLLLNGAARFEYYNDFGFTHNYKLASRYKFGEKFTIRGSFSTGFRAPSLAQIHTSSPFYFENGSTIDVGRIVPTNSPITQAAGVSELTQEKSLHAGFGFSFKPLKDFTLSADAYWINVKDRVVLSGKFTSADQTLNSTFLNALQQENLDYAQFFANAANTTNMGIELVLLYNKAFGEHRLDASLSANFQQMSIDQINVPTALTDTELHKKTFYSQNEQSVLLASAPPVKGALGAEYGYKNFSVGLRLNYFGQIVFWGYGDDNTGIDPKVPLDNDPNTFVDNKYTYSPKMVMDLYFSYKLVKGLTLQLGCDNLFNAHPDLALVPGAANSSIYYNQNGGPFDPVQMGINGRRLFARAAFSF